MRIAIMMANGCEEIEALAVVDLLRRAGITIDMVKVPSPDANADLSVTGSHGIKIAMDVDLAAFDVKLYDGIVLPGGMPGTNHLNASDIVKNAVTDINNRGGLVSAICAAPSVLGQMGILSGKKATCYPGFEDKLLNADACGERVVCDGNFITARGMGCAVDFGLAIVAYLKSADEAKALRTSVIAD